MLKCYAHAEDTNAGRMHGQAIKPSAMTQSAACSALRMWGQAPAITCKIYFSRRSIRSTLSSPHGLVPRPHRSFPFLSFCSPPLHGPWLMSLRQRGSKETPRAWLRPAPAPAPIWLFVRPPICSSLRLRAHRSSQEHSCTRIWFALSSKSRWVHLRHLFLDLLSIVFFYLSLERADAGSDLRRKWQG